MRKSLERLALFIGVEAEGKKIAAAQASPACCPFTDDKPDVENIRKCVTVSRETPHKDPPVANWRFPPLRSTRASGVQGMR